MQKTFLQIIEETKEDFLALILSRLELMKLSAVEKGVPAGVVAVYATIVATLLIVSTTLYLAALSFVLSLLFTELYGELLRALALGFTISGTIFLLPALYMIFRWKHYTQKFSDKYVHIVLDQIDEQNAQEAIKDAEEEKGGKA
ncbi:MAG: hypothetical protein Q3998_01225 [Porphyromonas sp.]|nr:hypothetical protein [Porphyromonas sp.]